MHLETLQLLQQFSQTLDIHSLSVDQIASREELLPLLCDIARNHSCRLTRADCIHVLGKLGTASEAIIRNTVIDAFKDQELLVQQEATQVLLTWSHRAVPGILQALRTTSQVDIATRRRIISLLGQMGTNAGAAWPLLQSLQHDPSLSDAVQSALKRLRPGWPAMLRWSVDGLMDLSMVTMVLLLPALLVMIFIPRGGWAWLPLSSAPALHAKLPWPLFGAVALVGVLLSLLGRWLLSYNPAAQQHSFKHPKYKHLVWIIMTITFLCTLGLAVLRNS